MSLTEGGGDRSGSGEKGGEREEGEQARVRT